MNINDYLLTSGAWSREKVTIKREVERANLPQAHVCETILSEDTARLLDILQYGILITDENCTVIYMNRTAERTLDRNADKLLGRPVIEALLGSDGELEDEADSTQDNYATNQFRIQIQTSQRDIRTIEVNITPFTEQMTGHDAKLYELHDVSESLRKTKQLIYEATHDPLTGLANRRALMDRLEQILFTTTESVAQTVLAVFDLDGFKKINDDCGHFAGDEVLREIAKILKLNIRKADMAARLGGDEFVVLLVGCCMREAHSVLETIRDSIQSYTYNSQAGKYSVTASIGVVGLNLSIAKSEDALQCADAACYRAKFAGGNKIVFHNEFDQPQRYYNNLSDERVVAKQLMDARNYVLYNQPLISLSRSRNSSLCSELLLRVSGLDGEVILPDRFLPLARRHGFERELDQWVLYSFVKYWLQARSLLYRNGIECFVNITRASLCATDETIDFITGLIDKYAFPASILCIDMQERDVIKHRAEAEYLIDNLRRVGVRFALDNVGFENDLISPVYMRSMHIDYIKLNAKVITRAATDVMYRSYLEALLMLSKRLDAQIIAVGVDNTAVFKRCMTFGIDLLQGYTLSKPELFDGNWKKMLDESTAIQYKISEMLNEGSVNVGRLYDMYGEPV